MLTRPAEWVERPLGTVAGPEPLPRGGNVQGMGSRQIVQDGVFVAWWFGRFGWSKASTRRASWPQSWVGQHAPAWCNGVGSEGRLRLSWAALNWIFVRSHPPSRAEEGRNAQVVMSRRVRSFWERHPYEPAEVESAI